MIALAWRAAADEGAVIATAKLCKLFCILRHSAYYQSRRSTLKVQLRFAQPIGAIIEKNPSFGYRAVAYLLNFNKNTLQWIFQVKGWQVKKRTLGFRPRI